MEQICRVCLGNFDTLLDIFGERQNEDETSLADMLNECAECKVNVDDELPKTICMACSLDAQTAFNFKRRYEQSYKLLTLKVEKKELEVDADDFCDMLAAEEWDLPRRRPDIDCIKIEIDESAGRENFEDIIEEESPKCTTKTPENYVEFEEHNQKTKVNKHQSIEEKFQKNMSPPFVGFEEKEESSKRYPVRQSKRKPYADHNENESDTSNNTDFSVDEEEFEITEIIDTETHSKVAGTGRAHKCLECPKAFNRIETLKAHKRTHTGERPYTCPYCPKVFAQSHHVRDHIHIHSGQRPHQCPHCPKAFSQKSNLQAHIYVHAGEGPHKCTHCPRSFGRNYDLKAHLRVHTGDRPYKCTSCPKAFNRRRDLERHIRLHTGEHPFKCTQCTLEFSRKDQLKTHVRGHEVDKIMPRVKREQKEAKNQK